ncbi:MULTISPECIES: YciI family protein [Microbispora]|nr:MULTISPECIES: YciI family protein [Microbispora]
MLSVYGNEDTWGALSPEEFAELIAEDAAFQKELRDSGELVSVHGLADAVNARTVRVRGGRLVVADGPYLETKEHLGCFFIIDCDGLDRALELASRYPAARDNGVEVWPLLDQGGTEM